MESLVLVKGSLLILIVFIILMFIFFFVFHKLGLHVQSSIELVQFVSIMC